MGSPPSDRGVISQKGAEMDRQQFKEYQDLASKYAKKKHTQTKKPHQPLHDYGREELPEWRKEPQEDTSRTLMAEEIDNLFWNKLVQLGWRINNDIIISNEKFFAKSVQFMFLCPECGKSLHTQQSHSITVSKARTMIDTNWLKIVVKKHKATSEGCHPAEYDENGEVIPEA